jgi:hypothetical protein
MAGRGSTRTPATLDKVFEALLVLFAAACPG